MAQGGWALDRENQARSALPLDPHELDRLCMRNLLETPGERVFFKDLQGRLLRISTSFLRDYAHGASLDEVIGKTDFDFFTAEHASAAFEDEQEVIRTGEPVLGKIERETFHDRPDAWVSTTKLPLRDDDGRIVGTFGISRDMTALILAEQALAHQAFHDPVTGLANRVALTSRLAQDLVSLRRTGGLLALLFVDLDNFKLINDAFGHEAGDRVLVEVGRRLLRVSRAGDTVARFGGDEFVMLCNGLRADDDVRLIATRAARAIGEQVIEGCNGNGITVTGSIGVAMTPDASADPDDLLRQADIAMYEAKVSGRNGFCIFDGDLPARALAHCDFGAAIRKAIDNSELFVLYQPFFSLEDASLCGAEALVRWRHAERGVLAPEDFIPLAEKRGLVDAIDSFVLDQACRQLSRWAREGPCTDHLSVAVSLSGGQLSDPALVERVASTIKRHDLVPSRLCLQITEAGLMRETRGAATVLSALSDLGVLLALGHAGTAYAVLAHAQRLNVDILKLDRSFVEQIGGGHDQTIIGGIVAMARALGMSVVCDGIAADRQLDVLRVLGCDEGQGFLWARPLPPEQVAVLGRSLATP